MNGSSRGSKSRGNALETEFVTNSGAEEELVNKKKVPFHKLFSFADSRDKFLMILSTIAAIGNGLSPPIMTMIIGDLIDVFAKDQKNEIASMVTKVSLKNVYLGLGGRTAAFLKVYCWTITGVRQDVAYYYQEEEQLTLLASLFLIFKLFA